MLIGILAATGLGMAMLSGKSETKRQAILSMGRRQLTDTDRGSAEANAEMLEELLAEQDRQIRLLDVPSLWETFAIANDDTYVVFIDDSVTDAHETQQEAINSAEYRSEEEGTERVYVDHLRFAPLKLQQRLLSYSDRQGGFDDGYDAANGISLASGHYPQMQRKVVWKWNMYTDEPFENWHSEAKESHRETVLQRAIKEQRLPAGKTLFHATNELEPWEGTGDYPWDLWLFESSADAVAHLEAQMEADADANVRAAKGAPRLLRFQTTEQIQLVYIDPDHEDLLETIFEIDFDDADDVEKNLGKLGQPEFDGMMFKESGHRTLALDGAALDTLDFQGAQSL